MNINISIPADVLTIIEGKRQQLRAEQAAKAEAEKREQDDFFVKGSQLYMDARHQSIELLPEWIRLYVNGPDLDIDGCVRVGRGWDKPNDWLTISIPGLANILFNSDKQAYLAATAWWNGYAEREPELDFNRDNGFRKDLEYVLCQAERALKEHQENLVKWEAAKAEALSQYNEQEAFDRAAEERAQERTEERAEQEAHEKTEAEMLFEIIQDDPIALTMLKTFVLLRDERSQVSQRLYEADESLYSLENRWSRRAEELRRQADEAERRAEDEKSRLQSDLDDAESKLKKAQREARGW